MRFLSLFLISLITATGFATAEDANDFSGKTVTIVVPSKPGGGTDASARLIASMITEELPGKPRLIVRNIPGGGGIPAINYFIQQTAPDGLTILMGSSSHSDPMTYRRPQAKYDPTKFQLIGAVGRGGSVLMIRSDAAPRLDDKAKPPVVMGSVGGVPRFSLQVTAWGIDLLGWNAKWVVGYRGTDDLMLAIDRGEVDMTATSNNFQINKLMSTGKFKVLSQTGALINGKYVPRPDLNAPLFSDLLEGKIKDATAAKAFEFWRGLGTIDKWVALAPGTPEPIVNSYREAFKRVGANPEFKERGKKISEDFDVMDWQDIDRLHKVLADTPPEAIEYISAMLRKQGLTPE